MNVVDNPYKAPSDEILDGVQQVFPSRLRMASLAKLSFWFGLTLAIIGSAITFYPGSECFWFVTTAFLMAPGILIPKPVYRTVAAIGVTLCLLYAYSGYQRGIKYQQRLQNRPTQTQYGQESSKN
jgi:hypothetical protein